MFPIASNKQHKGDEQAHAKANLNNALNELFRPKCNKNAMDEVEENDEAHPAVGPCASSLQAAREEQKR